MYGYVPHPATFYRGIEQVNPASVMTVEADGRVAQRKYWRLSFPDAAQAPAADYDVATRSAFASSSPPPWRAVWSATCRSARS